MPRVIYNLQLNDAVVRADIKHLAAKLVSQASDGVQVLVLVSQGLTGGEVARVEIRSVGQRALDLLLLPLLGLALGFLPGNTVLRGGDLPVVLEQLLEDLRAQDADLGQEQLTLDQGSVGVVQNSPDGDEVVQLATGLLDDAVQSAQDDGHAREVLNLGVADDETVDVESSGGEDTGDSREHTGLILDETVQHMALGRVARRHGGLVEDGRHGRRGIPLGRRVGGGQRERSTAVERLVGERRGRRAGRRVPARSEARKGRSRPGGCSRGR